MFDNLSKKLSRTFRNISGQGRLTEKNIKDTMHEVRIALLEADVALPVVRDFISQIEKNALGHEVNKSLTPGQKFIKIVHAGLVNAMGNKNYVLNLATQPPAVILIVGLQGAGKTTSVCKLGKYLNEKQKKKVLVVSTDIYRPAGIKQLEILANTISIDFFPSEVKQKPLEIVSRSLNQAKLKFYDILLVDTAGFLHIDQRMMKETLAIHAALSPIETLFVVDAIVGQDAVNIAKSFNQELPLTGIILTKLDGDSRGGAALSVRYITGKPIKFIGIGEKADALEPFYPDRLAGRILGMGDVLSLVEDIESKTDFVHAKKLVNKLEKGKNFNLNDFLDQLKQMRSMGGIVGVMSKLPSGSWLSDSVRSQMNDKVLVQMEAIINSMTTEECSNPNIIKGSRKRRIATGAGVQVQDINRLLKQFFDMQRIMKRIKKDGIKGMFRNMKNAMPPIFPNF